MSEIVVRPLAQSDHADWRRLWTDYLTFYETTLPEEVYAVTWKRLFTEGEFEPKGLSLPSTARRSASPTISTTAPAGRKKTTATCRTCSPTRKCAARASARP